jgi:hypothetical protein
MRRYEGCPIINNGQNYGTSFSVVSIRNNIKNNNINKNMIKNSIKSIWSNKSLSLSN